MAYSAGSGETSALPLACWMRAQKPANSGAARLVPPTCVLWPFTITIAPLLGSASKAMSGTPRKFEVPSTPEFFCHTGAGSVTLGPPPVPLHTVSPAQAVPLVDSVVPPMDITYGDTAG